MYPQVNVRKWGARSPSIMRLVALFGVTVLLLMLTSFAVMIYSTVTQERLQNDFVERSQLADQLVNDLYIMGQELESYRRGWDEESHTLYLSACADTQEDLDRYEQCVQSDSTVTLNYIRRLRNFLRFQMDLLISSREDSQRLYRVAGYVSSGLSNHQADARNMAQYDIGEARNQYQYACVHLRTILYGLVVVMLAFSLAGFIIMGKIYYAVKQDIEETGSHLKQLAACNWEIEDLHPGPYQELQNLAETVNLMKHELKSYMARIEEQAKLEKALSEEKLRNERQQAMMVEAQMASLRAQVNPHFLFNALNMIGMSALVETPEKVMELVEATGTILRYSLYTEGIKVLLDDEIEIVRKYLFLQKERFGDAITIEIDNLLEGEDYTVPSMSIQPLVENSFKHGFADRKHLHVRVGVRRVEDHLVVTVWDDGVGMDPVRLENRTGGIGLDNIARRLELQYKKRDLLRIQSELGKYTQVELHIPLEEE